MKYTSAQQGFTKNARGAFTTDERAALAPCLQTCPGPVRNAQAGFIKKTREASDAAAPAAPARYLQARPGLARAQAGFTLLELLVSVSLFVIVMTVSIGTLLSLVDANRQAQSIKSVTTNLNFAFDSMTRALRTGYNITCGGGDCASGGTSISFLDDQSCQVTYTYSASNHTVLRTIEDSAYNSSCDTSTNLALIAPEVSVNEMKFYVTGTTAGDDAQPTVTIAMKATAGSDPDTSTDFNLQATVTQRLLDL